MNDASAPRATDLAGLLDRLWRILAWPRLTVVLLAWVVIILVLSAVVPQAPPHIEDPIVRSQWLANIPIGVRPAVERLQPLGVFDLLDSAWLRLPLCLFLAHALVMLAALGPAIWHRLRGPAGEFSSLGQSIRLERDRSEPVDTVAQQLMRQLEKAGYRILPGQEAHAPQQDRKEFIAWRWRWSWVALAGLYLGLGLASLGLILEGWLGQVQEVNLGPDNPVPLPVAGAPNLVLEEVTVTGSDPLTPATGVALVRLLTGVGESQYLAPRLHNSYLLRGIRLTVAGLKPVAEVAAADATTGETVLLQPFSPRTPAQERIRLPLTGDPERQFIGVPSRNVTFRVDYQADAEGEDQQPGSAFSLAFFRGAESSPSRSASLPSGGEVTFDGVRYLATFDYDATLRINTTPWWLVVAAGWVVAALSIIVLAVASPIYTQGSVEEAEKGSRVTLMADILGNAKRLNQELQALLTPDT